MKLTKKNLIKWLDTEIQDEIEGHVRTRGHLKSLSMGYLEALEKVKSTVKDDFEDQP